MTNSEIELQAIALKGKDRDYQSLTINLLKPRNLIETKEMCQLKMPAQLDWQQGVILYGNAPNWLYAHLVECCHSMPWIGCYDIRSQAAVVVSSKVEGLEPGDTIPIVTNQVPGAAILIAGPPNSGKSVLSNGLRVSVAAKRPDVQIYLHRANWDGEGNHTYETLNRDLAEKLRKDNNFKLHKRPQAEELITNYFNYQADVTANIRQVVDLVLVDVGGVPDPAKTPVVERCSHYIIISNTPEKVQEWHHLCGQKLQPLAVIHSVLEERLEVIRTEPFLEIIAGKWDRDLPSRSCGNRAKGVPEILLKEILNVLE